MSARLVFATSNAHKVSELEAILAPAWEGFEAGCVARMSDFDVASPVEDGVTFEENSLIKARALARATGLAAIADDSGITVDVLGGAPGIFSARWSGTHGDDQANNDLLLAQMADIHERAAAFVSCCALATPAGEEHTAEGRWDGELLREPRGKNGFGYDPLFQPADADGRSSAELTAEEKNARSHRGKALRALAPHIAALA